MKVNRRERAFMFNWSLRKTRKNRRSYFEERSKQHEHLNEEFSRLEELLKENSIDQGTYERLLKLLQMGYKQKREETRLKYGFL
jgi:hypothetical protein